VLVAALAVVDDVISVVVLAVFYPHEFVPLWLLASVIAVLILFVLNRARAYWTLPYVAIGAVLWLSLHLAGIHAALSGILLAVFLPTWPKPSPIPLLAQAATALAALEHAEREARQTASPAARKVHEPVWDWASRNLSAASDRLLSPAERVERAVAPWSTYAILPLFAFSATGVDLGIDLSDPAALHIFAGIVLGLVVGKPVGIGVASLLATKTRLASGQGDITARLFVGAACLCGVGNTVALLLADQAFSAPTELAVAKTAILCGSVLSAALGVAIIATGARPIARTVAPATEAPS
jgi:NhaA family Na+:H+ antiporter